MKRKIKKEGNLISKKIAEAILEQSDDIAWALAEKAQEQILEWEFTITPWSYEIQIDHAGDSVGSVKWKEFIDDLIYWSENAKHDPARGDDALIDTQEYLKIAVLLNYASKKLKETWQ
jgi:hypothetical protein